MQGTHVFLSLTILMHEHVDLHPNPKMRCCASSGMMIECRHLSNTIWVRGTYAATRSVTEVPVHPSIFITSQDRKTPLFAAPRRSSPLRAAPRHSTSFSKFQDSNVEHM